MQAAGVVAATSMTSSLITWSSCIKPGRRGRETMPNGDGIVRPLAQPSAVSKQHEPAQELKSRWVAEGVNCRGKVMNLRTRRMSRGNNGEQTVRRTVSRDPCVGERRKTNGNGAAAIV